MKKMIIITGVTFVLSLAIVLGSLNKYDNSLFPAFAEEEVEEEEEEEGASDDHVGIEAPEEEPEEEEKETKKETSSSSDEEVGNEVVVDLPEPVNTPVEEPTEEAPTEAPSEEAPSEEAPSEEAPSEETPSEEVPVDPVVVIPDMPEQPVNNKEIIVVNNKKVVEKAKEVQAPSAAPAQATTPVVTAQPQAEIENVTQALPGVKVQTQGEKASTAKAAKTGDFPLAATAGSVAAVLSGLAVLTKLFRKLVYGI